MTQHFPKSLATAALGLSLLAAPALAQSTMSPGQCDAMMMAGTQNYSAEAVAACTPYFQTLARNAVAPGTFASSTTTVIVSTSGSGG